MMDAFAYYEAFRRYLLVGGVIPIYVGGCFAVDVQVQAYADDPNTPSIYDGGTVQSSAASMMAEFLLDTKAREVWQPVDITLHAISTSSDSGGAFDLT